MHIMLNAVFNVFSREDNALQALLVDMRTDVTIDHGDLRPYINMNIGQRILFDN